MADLNDLKKVAIVRLKELQLSDDTEVAHGNADDILCSLLIDLGCEEVINEYNKIDKWYA